MHLTKQESAGALPPEGRETAPKMANPVVVELPLKGEEKKAMFLWADLHLFVCGFKVNAGADEGTWSVFWLRGQRQIRGHGQAKALWQMASGIDLAHGAIQDKARFFAFGEHDISLPTAMPKGHFSRASAMLRLVSTIQLLAISLRSKPCTVSGSSSAIFQLPSQISRSGCGMESGFLAGH